MAEEYVIEEGRYGETFVPKTSWKENFATIMKKKRIAELYLNRAKGWTGPDLSFLYTIDYLKAIKIIDWKINDISPINTLHELLYLSVDTYCRTAIDFSNFPTLEYCFLEWRPKAKTIFGCTSLKHIYLNNYKGKDTSQFSGLTNLVSLRVGNSPISNLNGLRPLKKLKMLGLYNFRKLESLSGLEELVSLEELEIRGCRSVRSIEEIKYLSNLRRLEISDNHIIKTLNPITGLKKLDELLFVGNTVIEDGDLSPIENLKNLKHLGFAPKRHYTHNTKDFESLIKGPAYRTRFGDIWDRE